MTANRHSAAGPAAGFAYQFERALNWLAQKDAGASIGIETADDVEVCNSDATSVLEQDKHSLDKNALPFSDRSKGLWNTLAIWIEAVESGERSIDSTSFLMVTNNEMPDCIARHIAKAETESEIDACVAELQAAVKYPPKHISKMVSRVLLPESRESLRAVIQSIKVSDASDGTAVAAMRSATIAHLQLPDWSLEHSESIVNELLGWLHESVMSAWHQKQPAWVQRDHFVNQLHAVLDRRKRQVRRERAELLIPVTDDVVGSEKGRPFVQQLHFISDDDTIVDTAIREFIRCNVEKARLSKEGNITDGDWKEFESVLVSRWSKIRSRVMRIRSGAAEQDVGFDIFSDTTLDYREKLAGSDTEQVYLTSGTYHRLADLLTVGWHPRYDALMRQILDKR
jgi:hypothetical protein